MRTGLQSGLCGACDQRGSPLHSIASALPSQRTPPGLSPPPAFPQRGGGASLCSTDAGLRPPASSLQPPAAGLQTHTIPTADQQAAGCPCSRLCQMPDLGQSDVTNLIPPPHRINKTCHSAVSLLPVLHRFRICLRFYLGANISIRRAKDHRQNFL